MLVDQTAIHRIKVYLDLSVYLWSPKIVRLTWLKRENSSSFQPYVCKVSITVCGSAGADEVLEVFKEFCLCVLQVHLAEEVHVVKTQFAQRFQFHIYKTFCSAAQIFPNDQTTDASNGCYGWSQLTKHCIFFLCVFVSLMLPIEAGQPWDCLWHESGVMANDHLNHGNHCYSCLP